MHLMMRLQRSNPPSIDAVVYRRVANAHVFVGILLPNGLLSLYLYLVAQKDMDELAFST